MLTQISHIGNSKISTEANMKILITGGAGFIGSHLVEYYLAKGDEVIAVDDLSTGSKDNVAPFLNNPKFKFEIADILQWSGLQEAVASADYVYHLAAMVGVFNVLEHPTEVMKVNIDSCQRVLEAAVKVKRKQRIFIMSSSSVYGLNDKPGLSEEESSIVDPTAVRFFYAISKLVSETIASTYIHAHQLSITLPRPFNVIGPRQTGRYGMVVPRFVHQAINNKPITVFGDGKQTRSFCDVRDAVVALDLLAQSPAASGQIVNVGHAQEISIENLAQKVKSLAQSSSEIVYIPYKDAYGEDYEDTHCRRPGLEKLHQLTPFRHRWNLDDTLLELLRALKNSKA